jgi:excisionase family DNA binding protein
MSTLMTVQEIADYLRVNTKTVFRLLEKGKIPATRVGHLWRFDKSSIDAWLRTYSNSSVTADILVIDDDDAVLYSKKRSMIRHIKYLLPGCSYRAGDD